MADNFSKEQHLILGSLLRDAKWVKKNRVEKLNWLSSYFRILEIFLALAVGDKEMELGTGLNDKVITKLSKALDDYLIRGGQDAH